MNKSKPADQRSRAANCYARRKAKGLCPCGKEKRDFNQRTGKPYSYGPACRPIVAAIQKAQMRARRLKEEIRNG